MALAYPGEDSPLRQKIARDYFLAALDDPHFETRIRERKPPDLRTAYNTALRLESQYEAAHAMESDDAKNPSVERGDTPRSGRTPKSSRQRIRGTAGDFADPQLEALQKRVVQMEKPTACIDAEAQKKIDALETEAQQLRSELSKKHEQATAAADEKKAARPDCSKMKCAICGRIGHIATTFRQKNRPPEKQRMPLADRQCTDLRKDISL